MGRKTDGLLEHLVGDRLRGIDQARERGDAGVGRLKNLHTVADAVEQVGDVAGAGVEAGGSEEVGGIVERAVDLLAGGKAFLRGREQISSALQGEQVLADCRGEGDAIQSHGITFLVYATDGLLGRTPDRTKQMINEN